MVTVSHTDIMMAIVPVAGSTLIEHNQVTGQDYAAILWREREGVKVSQGVCGVALSCCG